MNSPMNTPVNKQTLEGNWMQLKGDLRERWGKLTDNDLAVINGKREQLVGRLKELYGRSVDEVDREVKAFEQKHLTHKTPAGSA